MAKVQVQVVGGEIKSLEADTVEQLKTQLGLASNYAATINGEPADVSDYLEDYQFVTFAPQVKGA